MDNQKIAERYFNPMFGSRATIREAMDYAYAVAVAVGKPTFAKKAVHIVHNTFLAKVALGPSDDLITPDPKYPVRESMKEALLEGYQLAQKTNSAPHVITAMHVMLNSLARHVYPPIEKESYDDMVWMVIKD